VTSLGLQCHALPPESTTRPHSSTWVNLTEPGECSCNRKLHPVLQSGVAVRYDAVRREPSARATGGWRALLSSLWPPPYGDEGLARTLVAAAVTPRDCRRGFPPNSLLRTGSTAWAGGGAVLSMAPIADNKTAETPGSPYRTASGSRHIWLHIRVAVVISADRHRPGRGVCQRWRSPIPIPGTVGFLACPGGRGNTSAMRCRLKASSQRTR
jgi:hypothetical protein